MCPLTMQLSHSFIGFIGSSAAVGPRLKRSRGRKVSPVADPPSVKANCEPENTAIHGFQPRYHSSVWTPEPCRCCDNRCRKCFPLSTSRDISTSHNRHRSDSSRALNGEGTSVPICVANICLCPSCVRLARVIRRRVSTYLIVHGGQTRSTKRRGEGLSNGPAWMAAEFLRGGTGLL